MLLSQSVLSGIGASYVNPLLLRWLVLAVIVAAAGVAGFVSGQRSVYALWLEEQGRQAAEATRIATARGEATVKVITKYRDRVTERAGQTQTVEKEVVRYVESKPLALACRLDSEWVRIHDAAAGAVPESPPGTDAPAGAFTAVTALSAVAANYGACLRTADRLEWLQAWVRSQMEVR